VSWSDPFSDGGGYGATPLYKLTEKRLNSGAAPAAVTLPSWSSSSVNISGKTPGEYEYVYSVRNCTSSGCAYFTPPSARLTVAVGSDAQPVVSPIEPTTLQGSTPYSANVNGKGQATISVPIRIPSGINNLQPHIGLNYNSSGTSTKESLQSAGGVLGFGWSLSGISEIRRCTKGKRDLSQTRDPYNVESGSINYRPWLTYTATDSLCLDGELLVLVAGANLQVGAEYRTYTESFKRITIQGTVSEPWFKVEAPNGNVLTYGNQVNSRVKKVKVSGGTDKTDYFLWSVDKETDRSGNSIYYFYQAKDESFSRFANKDRVYPSYIVYNQSVDRSSNSYYIWFDYTEAPFVALDSSSNDVQFPDNVVDKYTFTRDASKQLSSIRINRITDEVKYIIRGTGQDAHSLRHAGLKVASIQECYVRSDYPSGHCLNPISFNWVNWYTGLPIVDGVPNSASVVNDANLSSVVDSLGAITTFNYYQDRIDFWAFSENPFTAPPGAANQWPAVVAGGGWGNDTYSSDSKTVVVTRVDRSTGLAPNEVRSTSYRYKTGNMLPNSTEPAKGTNSFIGLGFLGFSAVRITDDRTGIVTYNKYEYGYSWNNNALSEPKLVASYQYDGVYGAAQTKPLSKSETWNDTTLITHGAFDSTRILTVKQITKYEYENSILVKVTTKTNDYTIINGFITKMISSVSNGGATESAPYLASRSWGQTALYNLSPNSVRSTRVTTTNLDNFTGTGNWYVGSVANKEDRYYNGSPTGIYTDTKSQRVDYLYFPQTMKIQSARRFAGDVENEITDTFSYDTAGRQLSVTTSGANIESRTQQSDSYFAYDSGSNITPGRTVNALNQIATFSNFDVRHDLPRTIIDINGLISTQEFDSLGRVSSSNNIDGVITTQAYISCITSSCDTVTTKNGIIVPSYFKEVDSPVSPKSREYYDSLGRVIRTETQGFVASENIRSDIQYNEDGGVYKSSLPYKTGAAPQFIVKSYDVTGRLKTILQPDGGSIQFTYDTENGADGNPLSRTTTTEFIKKPDGSDAPAQQKVSHFNSAGQLIKTRDALGVTTSFEYDALGKTSKTTVNGGVDGTTVSTASYDNAGNRTSISDPNIGTVLSKYTALGQMRWTQDNAGKVTTCTYDKLGRLLTLTNIDGVSNWYYDPVGAKGYLSYVTNNNGYTQTYYYQDANRLARLSRTETSITVPGLTPRTYVQSFTYDTYGRPQKTTSPSGYAVKQTYNAQGYPDILWRNDGQYPIQIVTKMGAFGVEDTAYNSAHQAVSYDSKSGRISSQLASLGSTKIQDLTYQWRSNGTLDNRVNNKSGNPITDFFQYDNQERLVSTATAIGVNGASGPLRTINQGYSNLGNLLSNTSTMSGDSSVTGYQYASGRPHAVSGATINGDYVALGYDANGAIISYDAPGTAQDKYINYNAANQPINITVGASLSDPSPIARDEFRYAPDGSRYYKRSTYKEGANLRVEQTVYVGGYEATYFDALSTIKQSEKTQVGESILHVLKTPYSGGTIELQQIIYRDHLGSVDAITNWGDSSLTVNMAFEPFGARRDASSFLNNINNAQRNLLLSKSDSLNSQGFTGHENLDRTGLIHMNGRVYDPVLGRFLSPDPLTAKPSNSQSWNRYSYVANNPLKYADPSGFKQKICGEQKDCVDEVVVLGRDGGVLYDKSFLDKITSTESGIKFPTLKESLGQSSISPDFLCDNNGSTNDESVMDELQEASELEPTWSSYLPGTEAGDNALDYWAAQYVASGDNYFDKAMAGTGMAFSSLWTKNTAANVGFTLGTAGIGSLPQLGPKLFLSTNFGITSTRFANSVTGVHGTWNITGSFLKIGWSGVTRNGGGMMIRIGIGGTGNTARFHFYIPKTFVPNSFANGSIKVKKALYLMGE
jgi:RHS repeat-associated protein